MEAHIPGDDLELYSLGRLPDAEAERLEVHLLVCQRCQHELVEIDRYVRAMRECAGDAPGRLRSIHVTEDGPIFGAIRRKPNGAWFARHWGSQLDGGRTCSSVEEANAYLIDSFRQMFPEHVCGEQCREEWVTLGDGAISIQE